MLGGAPAAFRTGPAFAKQGRERYGLAPDTEAAFHACIADTDDDALDPIGRAARVYLDVCFYHPFPDGNCRAARIALDFVLTRAGLTLSEVRPLFLVPRWAHDVEGARSFLRLARMLAA